LGSAVVPEVKTTWTRSLGVATRDSELRLVRQQEFCRDLLLYSSREIRSGFQIERNNNRATQ
jgi:hypothetical protein